MSHLSNTEVVPDREVRQESVSELLEYSISFNEDNTLEWNPPVGSKELAIALSYHFPREEKVEKKMQAATMKFLRAEHRRSRASTPDASGGSIPDHGLISGDGPSNALPTACETPIKHLRTNDQMNTSEDATSDELSASIVSKKTKPDFEHNDKDLVDAAPDKLKIVSWSPGRKASNRGKKRRYGSEERVKVASNRGYACDEHRRQKVKCDPDVCPRNKQKLLAPASSQKSILSSITDRSMRTEADTPTRKGMNSDQANNSNISPDQTLGLEQTPFHPLLPDPSDPVRIGLSEVDMPWHTLSPTPMDFPLFDSTFLNDQKAFEESVDKFYFPVVPHYDLKIKSVDPPLFELHELIGGLFSMKLDDA